MSEITSTVRTSKVATDDCLEWDDFGLLHQHRASLELILVLPDFLWHLVDVCCDEVVRNDIRQLAKPVDRDLRE